MSRARQLIEIVLLVPATVTYGLTAAIGLPIAAIGFALGGREFPAESQTVLFILAALGVGALVGLTATWAAVLSAELSRRLDVRAGVALGVVTAAVSVFVTFSNDDFQLAVTMTNNAVLLIPLIAAGLAGVSQLVFPRRGPAAEPVGV